MRQFLIKIGWMIALFAGLYLLVFYCVDKGLRNSDYRDVGDWNQIRSGEINADILVMGSSRAWRQIDPEIIANATYESVYNMGIDGYHIPMQLAKYDYYLSFNEAPKKIIYILDHFSLDKREDLFNKEQFLTVFDDSKMVESLKQYDGYKFQHYNIPYFRYSGTKEYCLAGFSEFVGLKDFKADKVNGFRSKDAPWEAAFDLEKKQNPEGKRAMALDSVNLLFDKFLEQRNAEQIEVILVYPPDYIEFQEYINNRDSIFSIYQKHAEKYELKFIDYSNHPLCLSKEYFYNPTHLNAKGSHLLSEDLANKLSFKE